MEQQRGPGHDTVEDLSFLWGDLRVAVQRRGLDFHSSEDVVQESWLSTLRRGRLHELDLRGWLTVVTARLAGKHRMGQRRRLAREQAVARSEAVEPHHLVDEGSFLLRCVHEMAEPYGRVIRMRYLEEREVEEIAARLHRSPGTIRSQIKRGLQRLRARLQEGDPRRAYSLWLTGLLRTPGAPPSRIRPAWGNRFAIVAAAGVLLIAGFCTLLLPDSRTRMGSRVSAIPSPASEPAGKLSSMSRSARHPETGARAGAPRTGVVLAGTVREPSGDPVAGAEVFAGRWNGGAARRVAVTDESGRFELSDIGPDEFVWGTGGAWCASPRRYVATLAGESECDLVLKGTGERFTVLVRTADAEPVVGARVELALPTRLRTKTWLSVLGTLEVESPVTGITDGAGLVELPRPLAGPVRVIVSADDHPTLTEKVSLAEGCDRKEIVLHEPATIAGRVLDEGGQPAWKASVEVLQSSQPVRQTWTGPDGSFEMTSLRPGSFALRASEDPAIGYASCSFEGAVEVGAVARLELELSPRFTIRGRAGHGAALAGGVARLSTLEEGRNAWVERTAQFGTDGKFAFPACPDRASHRLDVFAPGSPVPWGWLPDVHPGTGQENLVLPATSGDPLVVEFECADPRLLPVIVELRHSLPQFSVTARVDAETARATFPALPLSSYLAVALVPGLGTWRAGEVDGSGASRLQRIRVREPGSVSGELRLPPGTRMESVSAWVVNPDGFGWGRDLRQEIALGKDGRFRVELFPGDYDFGFECSALAGERRRVRVEEGQDQPMTIEPIVGILAQFRLRLPRRLGLGEDLRLEALVPGGCWQADLVQTSEAGGIDFRARAKVPVNASTLEVVTNQGLEGRVLLDPAWTTDPMPEIEIELLESR